MMERFGLLKCLPVSRLRTLQPVARLIPDRFVSYISPMKIGRVDVWTPSLATNGEVWISPVNDRKSCSLLRKLNRLDVIGIEGLPVDSWQGAKGPAFTNGNALELTAYLAEFKKNGRNAKSKVAVGGHNPAQVSTVARLLGREVEEMVLIGEEPFLPRLAGQVLAESGLSVRIRPVLPKEHFQRVIACGSGIFPGIPCDRLFVNEPIAIGKQLIPWSVRGSSEKTVRELHSFAAAEAILMALGGWKRIQIVPGIISVAWAEYIVELVRDLGFRLPLEALDTLPPVGYNVNNL